MIPIRLAGRTYEVAPLEGESFWTWYWTKFFVWERFEKMCRAGRLWQGLGFLSGTTPLLVARYASELSEPAAHASPQELGAALVALTEGGRARPFITGGRN